MRVAMIVVLALVAVVAVQAQSFEREVVSLDTWQANNIPIESNAGTGREAVWEVQSSGVEVRQDVNSEPSMFFDPQASRDSSFTANVRVNSEADDDFVGFALGFRDGDWTNPDADWILIDWKQNDQLDAPEGAGRAGLAVSRVRGAISDNTELYAHTGPVEEIARAQNLGSTGWEDFTLHRFRITLTGDRLFIVVDGRVEFDLQDDASDMFPEEASIGFYVFSQQNTVFQLLNAQTLQTAEAGVEKNFVVDIDESDSITAYTLEVTYPDGSVESFDFRPNGDEAERDVPLSYTFEAGLRTVEVRIFINGAVVDEQPILFDVSGVIVPPPVGCSVVTISSAQLDANDGLAQSESDSQCACIQFVA